MQICSPRTALLGHPRFPRSSNYSLRRLRLSPAEPARRTVVPHVVKKPPGSESNGFRTSSKSKSQKSNGKESSNEATQKINDATISFSTWWSKFMGKVSYDYYLWRKDTVSDLQLFAVGFISILMTGSFIKSVVVNGRPPDGILDFWGELYDVLVLSFGQDFPPKETTSMPEQIFSVLVAYAGVLSFAMVLALVEQVVLEVIEKNVRRGSRVYESGHTLIVGWCNSQRDVELVWKILEQLCYAHQNSLGHTVVVMTQRSKLEMESLFRRVIPETERFGTEFVFRVGNPLIPADLQFVAADQAATTIVVSDQSRCPEEADAQSARCAILLDEMLQANGKSGYVIVEVKTSNSVPLIKYACSTRVVPIHTTMYAARRLVKMFKAPFIARISQMLLDFKGSSCFFVHPCPQVVGKTFAEIPFYFPDAIVVGVLQYSSGGEESGGDSDGRDSGMGAPFSALKTYTEEKHGVLEDLFHNRRAMLNPPDYYMIQPSDELVFVRPTKLANHADLVLEKPVRVRIDNVWLMNLERKMMKEVMMESESVMQTQIQKHQPHGHAQPPKQTGVHDHNSNVGHGTQQQQQQAHTHNPSNTGVQDHSSDVGHGTPPQQQQQAHAQPPPHNGVQDHSSNRRHGSKEQQQQAHGHHPSHNAVNGSHSSSGGHGTQEQRQQQQAQAHHHHPPHNGVHHNHSSTEGHGGHEQQHPSVPLDSHSSGHQHAPLPFHEGEPEHQHITFRCRGSNSDGTEPQGHAEASHAGADHEHEHPENGSHQGHHRREHVVRDAAEPGMGVHTHWHATPGTQTTGEHAGEGHSYSNERDRHSHSSLPHTLNDDQHAHTQHGRNDHSLASHKGEHHGRSVPSHEGEHHERTSQPESFINSDQPQASSSSSGQQSNVLTYKRNRSATNHRPITKQMTTAQRMGWRLKRLKRRSKREDAEESLATPAGERGAEEILAKAGLADCGCPDGAVESIPTWDSADASVQAARTYLAAMDSNMALAMKMVPMEYFFSDDNPEKVLVCGWGEQSMMSTLIREADRGQMALPPGSELVFMNTHDYESSLQLAERAVSPVNIKVTHVEANPMIGKEMSKICIQQFKVAVVLCDERWVDPDMDNTNGIDALQQQDMLRLDSMVMMVQLNIRKLNEEANLPAMNIICQKVAMEGQTRFECRQRLPLGISMSLTAYAAKNLAQVAYNHGYAFVGDQLYMATDTQTIDTSELCRRGERVSFWELMLRARKLDMVLLGYYFLPSSLDAPVHSVINPMGNEERSRLKVWNNGDFSHKFVVIRNRKQVHRAPVPEDDNAYVGAEKAPWVYGRIPQILGTSDEDMISMTTDFDSMEEINPLDSIDGDEMPLERFVLPTKK